MVQSTGVAAPEMALASGAGDKSLTQFIDRWIFVFMAALLIVVTLLGFLPDSVMKVEAVSAGKRLPFPLILHAHAVVMGTWLLLLLAQTTLMATGRREGHKQLGLLSLVLAPALVIVGVALSPVMYHQLWAAAHAPGADPEMMQGVAIRGNIVLIQAQIGFVFACTVYLALRARITDPATHKRLMILAPIAAMPAAVDRMAWLPSTMPASPLASELYALLLALPLFAWDLYRTGTVLRAYRIWLALLVTSAAVMIALWGSPWWQAFVPKLMGVA